MSIDHSARASKAWRLLAKRANAKLPPFSYGELCNELGLHHRSAGWFLGIIQAHCKKKKLPPLQALAVNKRTKLPGFGYSGSPRTREAHDRALKWVRSISWSTSAPPFER